MTTLLLIRHGQASFGSGDYDRLCDTGVRQSRLLGAHLAAEGRVPAAAWHGTLRRQAETAGQALAAGGFAVPVKVEVGFDEYPSDALFAALAPLVAAGRSELAPDRLRADRRLFQAALEGVLALWHEGAAALPPALTWPQFRARVRAAMETAVAGCGHDELVLAFTSGGVIGTAVGEALDLPPPARMALSWRLLNASVTELHYGRRGWSLAGFNAVAHLRLAGEDGLLTYR